MHQVLLDGNSENMDVLVQTDKYGASNTTNASTMGYYVIKFVSKAYRLQYRTMWYGKTSTDVDNSERPLRHHRGDIEVVF